MNKSKSFQELNLVDGFLFGASTENPEDAEYIAKLIIKRVRGLFFRIFCFHLCSIKVF